MNLHTLTALELRSRLDRGSVKPQDILADLRGRYEAVEKKVMAFARPPSFEYRDGAAAGALKGIPVVIKDNICSQGDLTECCSKILKGFVAPYDATVVERLKKSGASIMGKANMDEFAFGSSCETSCFHPTRNPWNLDCVPGGSSGGSCACVVADEAIVALGSDTGGSIRQPASLCGVVGMKPTYGRVSRYGLVAFASSLDQIGPITKDVRDNALVLGVIAGHDDRDATSAHMDVPDYLAEMEKDIRGLRVAIPREYFVEGMDADVRQAMMEAKAKLESLGARFGEVRLPHTDYAVAVYYIIATAEASSNLARFDGVQYGLRQTGGSKDESALVGMYKETRDKGFGAEAKRRLILGTYVLSSGYYDAYYLRASRVRRLIREDFDKVFKEYDVVLTPTSPTPAFRIGEKMDNPLSMYLSDIYTISVNLAGVPAISVPCGFTGSGLPVGMQLIGRPFGETDLYRAAFHYEQGTSWHKQKPKL
ncbi:aspartyl-tRNA(Asn) amidotransferase subunit A and Glutamyl-tRNA(Gln) amidotransferase subunit A [Candidatus Velamenicoccus archaeovorus]|uniref:Glutamyl-tRNA(Gln) amidotransferase subunit A n=1 Tax=Velamenicoccus archaeovorus TaxID=1930593 RepID=A0A410P584_VELA1|nr:Asp-tRNA(Asn)/Glu-tRNA(Gln) amidotransferase subunit GatA [Candidatus Velamenicoccus archaeovorus]QAT17134.1 aspartyl-tRNA(Asn) amidotransferase subunit A and Glutamyl-tRNA(Gln) amidotransferase subunit A [Candidatus Velamenicoccus archaeovorus]